MTISRRRPVTAERRDDDAEVATRSAGEGAETAQLIRIGLKESNRLMGCRC
jgi:hypothetical protein